MKNKAISFFLCMTMMMTLAVGCGSGQDGSFGENAAAAGAEDQAAAEDGGNADASEEEASAEKSGEASAEEPGEESGDTSGNDYEPVTITLNLERSGLGENVEYTFTEIPNKVVASGDQMADFFFDLGLEEYMAGYTKGSAWSLVADFPAREQVPQLAEPGVGLSTLSKEELLATGCDFLIGWDSVFSDRAFDPDFCNENGIAMYFPYVCSDSATFEDLYKDYETLGKIFKVEDVAAEKIQTMKDRVRKVQDTLGEEVYQDPVSVFVYDSGEDAPFTACQGMPGDIIRLAGGESIFSDIEAGWATPSWEEVVERDPDVILVLDYNGDVEEKVEFLKNNDVTKDLRAVKEGKIYSACCADMQGSADSAHTVEIIAQQLYPDLFA